MKAQLSNCRRLGSYRRAASLELPSDQGEEENSIIDSIHKDSMIAFESALSRTLKKSGTRENWIDTEKVPKYKQLCYLLILQFLVDTPFLTFSMSPSSAP